MRTLTSVTRLQAKERGHDFHVQDNERICKDGHKHPIFTDKTQAYKRSHSESLQMSCHESCKGYSFSQRVVNDWNSLPTYVVMAPYPIRSKKY